MSASSSSSARRAAEETPAPDPKPVEEPTVAVAEKRPEDYDDGVLPISRQRSILLYFSLCTGMFLSLLDTSIVATALFSIGVEFGALTRVTWVALAYTLAYLGWAVPFASLADVIGRRAAYLLAFGLFLVFSLACGWAPSLEALIAFRTMQGIGGAGLYSLTMVIFPEITPPNRSAVIGALAGTVVAVAGIVGPVLGGVVTNYATWRWVFWLNGPVALPAMVVVTLAWPKPEQMRAVQKRRSWRELDFVGIFLLIAASVLVVYAFQEAGIEPDSWASASFLAPLLTGLACWALLFAWQWYVARNRRDRVISVFPWHLLKQRVFVSNALLTLLMGFPYFLAIFALPLRFQIINQATPLLAGVWLLPMLGGAAVGSTLGGMLNSKVSRVTWVFVASSVLLALGSGLLTTLDSGPSVQAKVYGFELFVGLGFGLAVSTSTLCTALESSLRDAAVAQGIVAQARVFGGSLGIAAITAIQGVTQRRELAGIVSPDDLAHLQQSRASGHLSPLQLLAIRESYAHSFTLSFKVCTAISATLILTAAGTYRKGRIDVVAVRREKIDQERERARKEALDLHQQESPPEKAEA